MRAREFLIERISSQVFHYTRVGTALKILQSGEFELSHTLGTSWEQQFAPKGYPYFLSTTRTRRGGYHDYIGQDAVLFELDGDFYNQRYPGRAVDYWNNRDPLKSHHRPHEAEDRIFSREPAIPAAVRVVDIYIAPDADEAARARARRLMIVAKQRKTSVNLFNDKEAWLMRDTRHVADVSQLRGQDPARGYVSRRRGGYLKPWMELIQAKQKSQLSKDADSKRYALQYTYDKQQMTKSLAVDLSNARKPGPDADRNNAVRVIQFMQQNRMDTVNDLVNFLADKWKNIKEGVAEGLEKGIPKYLYKWVKGEQFQKYIDAKKLPVKRGYAHYIDSEKKIIPGNSFTDEAHIGSWSGDTLIRIDTSTFGNKIYPIPGNKTFLKTKGMTDNNYDLNAWKYESDDIDEYWVAGTLDLSSVEVVNKGVAEDLRDVTIGSKLTELFNTQPSKSAAWARPIGQWEDMDQFNFVASNGIAYQVDFLAPWAGPDELAPYVFFEPDEEISDQAYESAKFVEFEQKSKPGDVGKQGIEGTGAAAEVFGIVTNVILQYIKKAKPSMLYFQAAEPNRQRLYARMAPRIAQTIGWKVKRDGPAHFAIYNPRKIKANVSNQDVAEDLRLVDTNIEEGINDPAIFKLVFVVGGPGSGKSYVSRRLGLNALGLVTINSDMAFEYLMQKHELNPKMPPEEKERRDAVRDRAKSLTSKKSNLAIEGRLGIHIDGTGDDFQKVVDLKKNFEQLGYDSYLVVVNTQLAVARQRNQTRSRTVPDRIVVNSWNDVQNNIGRFDSVFKRMSVIDNSGNEATTEPQISRVYSKLAKFIQEPPSRPAARQWIKLKNQGVAEDLRDITELRYLGNLGIMELVKFFREYPQYKEKYLEIKNQKGTGAANQFAFNIMKVELEPIAELVDINMNTF